MLYALDRQQLYATMGGGTFQQIGLVLEASGVNSTLAHSTLSFCLSRTTYEEEIEEAIAVIVETAQKLRKLSEHITLT